jgi:hypothetical protein
MPAALSGRDDIALGYKQLSKSNAVGGISNGSSTCAGLSPQGAAHPRARHRVLALPLTRTVEATCGGTWSTLRRELERITVGTFAGPAGTFRQRTELTTTQRAILAQLELADPPAIYQPSPAQPSCLSSLRRSRVRARAMTPETGARRGSGKTRFGPPARAGCGQAIYGCPRRPAGPGTGWDQVSQRAASRTGGASPVGSAYGVISPLTSTSQGWRWTRWPSVWSGWTRRMRCFGR